MCSAHARTMIGRQAADQPDMYVFVSVSLCVDDCARPCLVMAKLSFGCGPPNKSQ